jgi:hypothetical protein
MRRSTGCRRGFRKSAELVSRGRTAACPGLEPGPFQTPELGTVPGQARDRLETTRVDQAKTHGSRTWSIEITIRMQWMSYGVYQSHATRSQLEPTGPSVDGPSHPVENQEARRGCPGRAHFTSFNLPNALICVSASSHMAEVLRGVARSCKSTNAM